MSCKARESAERMAKWFEDYQVPDFTMPHPWMRIYDTKQFVKTAVDTMLNSEAMSENFLAAYFRLYELKKYLEGGMK